MQLPLIDNCLFIDNSALEILTSCPRAFEYSFIRKCKINKAQNALNFGTAIHKALETRYKIARNDTPTDEIFQKMTMEMEKSFLDAPVEEDDHRTLNWATDLIKKYNEIYHTEPFNVLLDEKGNPLIELSFALPLFEYGVTKVIYTGKIDLPVWWDNAVWIGDNKTASRLGETYFKGASMSSQLHGYAWAFETLTGKKVAGFFPNVLRTSAPPAKTPKNGWDAWWRETLQRQRFYSTDEDRQEWKNNTIALVKQAFQFVADNYFPKYNYYLDGHGIRCGNCQFYSVCSYPADKREMILQSEEYKENTWSPLQKQNKQETT